MRIAIVNDLAIACEALRQVVTSDPSHSVAWIARDGAEAIVRCRAEPPDLVLMDLIMPGVDGVAATRRIMTESPVAILVVTATVQGNASRVFEALAAGALDAVDTPVLGDRGSGDGSARLLAKIARLGALVRPARAAPALAPVPPPRRGGWTSSLPVLAIGASTGGPGALATLLGGLPADLGVPIGVVQHVDARFAQGLAEWLDSQCPFEVRSARVGDRLEAGRVLVAASNDHLVLEASGALGYTAEPAAMVYRPSVDVFFTSLVEHWPRDGVAVLLTGMGRDGAAGLLSLRQMGWHTIAQDEASSVVYGMPRAAAELGAAVEVLPITAIAGAVRQALEHKARRSR